MEKIKYLHIMPNEKFISSFIQFVDNNFDIKEHKFLILGGVNRQQIPILDNDNIIVFQNFSKWKVLKIVQYTKILNKYLKKAENVYLHSLFNKNIIVFFYLFRRYLRKSNWIIWGGDLYCYEKRNYSSLKNRIWYSIEDYVKRNIEYVNTLVPGDYDIAKKYYNVKGKYKEIRYPCELIETQLDNSKNVNKKETYIQIGNSGDSSNNHIEILNCLKKYKNFNIKIFAVLSYGGNKDYINKVKKYGEELFGSKFIPILGFMPYEKYWEYLSNIDILIFNHKRQQGLGNIVMLSYFEKKIYLRSDISSWDYLTTNIGLKLNDYAQITKQNFEEFKDNNAFGNREICLKTFYSKEYIKNILEKNFNNEFWWKK